MEFLSGIKNKSNHELTFERVVHKYKGKCSFGAII